MNEVKRGPGRPPKVSQPDVAPPKAKTAQERIDEIELQTFKGNGFIVPRPDELTLETFRQWMRETAEIGSGDHVGLVWQYGNQSKDWRKKLENEYHMLQRMAGKRWADLQDQARAEKHQADAEYRERADKAANQRAIAQAKAKLAALEAAQ